MDQILFNGLAKTEAANTVTAIQQETHTIKGLKLENLKSFKTLDQNIYKRLKKIDCKKPLDTQQIVIPYCLHNENILVKSSTGSGKTLAFLVPSVYLSEKNKKYKFLILAHSVALVDQIYNVCRLIKNDSVKIMKYDGHGISTPRTDLKLVNDDKEIHYNIIITTPDHLEHFKNVTHLVVDEADQIIKENQRQIKTFISNNKKLHLSVFSATISKSIRRTYMRLKKMTMISIIHKCELNNEFVFATNEKLKKMALVEKIRHEIETPTLVFVKDWDIAEDLHKILDNSIVFKENKDLDSFRIKEKRFMIATDDLARGMDFLGIRSIVHYDLPTDRRSFIHRAGRINRNGRSGEKMYTFYTKEEFTKIGFVIEYLKEHNSEVPNHIVKLLNKK